MVLPVALIFFAVCAAGFMAYGTHPGLVQYSWGLDAILLSRRLEWPLVAVSLLLCVALIALVIGGRRRAWWLIGLAPVLALFMHRFATSSINAFEIVENPTFVPAASANFVQDNHWVVGLEFEGHAYAYPYATLYTTPVVVHSNHDKRMMLLWSPFANRAVAQYVTRELKVRNLEIVSMPANALVVYDGRIGQFINGLTGTTFKGNDVSTDRPVGFGQPIATRKMTWLKWRQLHPQSLVLAPRARTTRNPTSPVLPYFPLPKGFGNGTAPLDARIVMIETTRPIALPAEEVSDRPMNLVAGEEPIVVFRDRETRLVRAFDRRLEADLSPRFSLNTDPRRPGYLVDADTNTTWTSQGVAADTRGDFRGRRLARIPVEEELYWGVMKFWYPELRLLEGATGERRQ